MYKDHMNAEKAIEIVETKNPRSHMNRWQKNSLINLETYMPRV
jgi:hypothetical protein